MTYSEKLKDPRWQKKRLEVLERDGWACQWCGATTDTLAVHHLYYLPGWEPWDYPIKAYLALCDHCHAGDRENRGREEKALLERLKAARLAPADVCDLGIVACQLAEHDPDYHYAENFILALRWWTQDKERIDSLVGQYHESQNKKKK